MGSERMIMNNDFRLGLIKIEDSDYIDENRIELKEEKHGISAEFKATDFDKGVLTIDQEFYISPLGTKTRYELIKSVQAIFKAFQGKRDGKHFRLFESKKDFPLLFVCGQLGIVVAPYLDE